MNSYKSILVAIDLQEDSTKVLEKAFQIKEEAADIHIIFVLIPMTTMLSGGTDTVPYDFDPKKIHNMVLKQSVEKMNSLLEKYDIPVENRIIKTGKPASQIKQYAKEIDADLIAMGTHGQKGLELLLGSTANGVLHGSPCDVLSILIKSS